MCIDLVPCLQHWCSIPPHLTALVCRVNSSRSANAEGAENACPGLSAPPSAAGEYSNPTSPRNHLSMEQGLWTKLVLLEPQELIYSTEVDCTVQHIAGAILQTRKPSFSKADISHEEIF